MPTIDSPTSLTASARVGRMLQALATALLLMCVAGRLFLTEMPFRTPVLDVSKALAGEGVLNTEELTRASFALIMLSAAAAWLIGQACQDRLFVRRPALLLLTLLF